uniref:Uncharacterized protein n=1 Tax=Oryza barthii TaxID=65489 RepID=A0A0D3F672_9ORYZ
MAVALKQQGMGIKHMETEGEEATGGAAAKAAVAATFADAAMAASSGTAAGGDSEKPLVKEPLPQAEVDFILAWKREPSPCPDDVHWALLSPEQRQLHEEMAAMGKEFEDSFEEFQDEVRREVEENGCYMVDESYYTDQAEMQAQLKEGWAAIDWSDVVCADWDDFNDPNCYRSL